MTHSQLRPAAAEVAEPLGRTAEQPQIGALINRRDRSDQVLGHDCQAEQVGTIAAERDSPASK